MESADLSLESCPRCGVRLEQTYKYCPHCAYRLRPELGQEPRRPAPARATPGARLVALGGYLAFSSLLLLVTLAGFRLFAQPEVPQATTSDFRRARDAGTLALTRESFHLVPGGVGLWGAYSDNEQVEEITSFRVDDPFEIGIYEVTNDQYYVFLQERAKRSGAHTPRRLIPLGWRQPSGDTAVPVMYDSRTGNQPVLGVPFRAALEFCAWFWETRLGSPPDLLVDLPTTLEYVWAARGDHFDYNFPWGQELDGDAAVNLDGRPADVDDAEKVGCYDDVFALVGNAAEWVHGFTPDGFRHSPTAAGWSFENSEYRTFFREPISPFTSRSFRWDRDGAPRGDLGFRIILRPAPSLPEFVAVSSGPVHYGLPPPELLPPTEVAVLPERNDEGDEEDEDEEADMRAARAAAAIRLQGENARVSVDFEIGRCEVTNRQYLRFLVETADDVSSATLDELFPDSITWRRDRNEEDVVFVGPYGPPAKINRLFAAGRENHPVEGVTPEQAEAYARWLSSRLRRTARLPAVEEYLRAARGAGRWPYPWGTDKDDRLLVCAGRGDDEGRAVSLPGRFGDRYRLYGLAGNLPELVWDAAGHRYLLAGGCYMFPPSCCTLDTYVALDWKYVEYIVRSLDDDTDFERPRYVGKPADYAGFRLVIVRGRP